MSPAVAVRSVGAPGNVESSCTPTLINVNGSFWLLYSVKSQPAERAMLESRTSSIVPGKNLSTLVPFSFWAMTITLLSAAIVPVIAEVS